MEFMGGFLGRSNYVGWELWGIWRVNFIDVVKWCWD